MKNLLFAFILLIPSSTIAQVIGPLTSTFDSFRQNGISSIATTGDTLWISPYLNRNIDNAPDWFRPSDVDSIENGIGRVFSLDVNQDTVVAGLGFTSATIAGSIPAGYGYYISIDGGDSWRFSDFLLDRYVDEDTTFVYGTTTYTRKRIIVPEQSPPYGVAFKGNVIFSVNWASGLLRSTDFGQSWERVVLPPFGVSELTPTRSDYYWFDCLNSSCSESQNVYDSVEDDNLKGFSILIDSKNRVWFGSAGGINYSENALTAPIEQIAWKNVTFTNSSTGLLARWIVTIKEDPATGKIWMNNWLAESSTSALGGQDSYGVVVTENGETFEQHLIGEKIHDFAFKDGYIFAAGDNGIFISDDGGNSWVKQPQIKSANAFLKSTTSFQSAAITTDRVWIGSDDGIISTDDYGKTWEINRLNFPLNGGNTYDSEAPSVETYAYPNPFSPTQHEIVRIRFDLDEASDTRIRIFDFGMNLVRELESGSFSTGSYEAIWDGLDGKGRQVASGAYFYQIESAGKTVNGKILLIQ